MNNINFFKISETTYINLSQVESITITDSKMQMWMANESSHLIEESERLKVLDLIIRMNEGVNQDQYPA